jgi:hypothetical protein
MNAPYILLIGHGVNIIEGERFSGGLELTVHSEMSGFRGSTVVVCHRVSHAVDTAIVMLCQIRYLRRLPSAAQ